ncbi:protein kinase [Gloeocapsa sp. PCC 73106]|uniref:protein kinase domain-containing protein n=1 Tax=Gloeocapsa sp. PCC 73106 TaxID=102232 RepID=UPI0002ACE977|nr:protein kinase [Gloeocapsa sp. PCC 73106]ELR96711.1 protein kinase family protein [Gloeocapsa sp. PCC 73106]
MVAGPIEIISLKDWLVASGDRSWLELSQKIVNPLENEKPIIDCTDVNPSDLSDEQKSFLFYLPQQQGWRFAKYVTVFHNVNDELGDFLSKVINGTIIIADPIKRNPLPNVLTPGTLIGHRYEIVKLIGKGSFGQTYLARDTNIPGHPQRLVKQFKPVASEEGTISTAKEQFTREAAILAQLSHNCIPQLYDYFEEHKEFYLVQELIQGSPLNTLMEAGHPWSESEITKLLEDILEPLKYLHSQNIIHRDIKPSNLIRRDGDGKIVLIDFGSVKAISPVLPKGGAAGTIIGTRGYMSPEQSIGTPRLSSDLFSVGMVAIQAATGCEPQEKGHSDWKNHTPHLKPRLKEFIDKLTSYNYTDRYNSAGEALEALKAEPPDDKPITPNKPIHLKKVRVAVLSLMGLGALGVFLISIPYFRKPKISVLEVTIGTLWAPESYSGLSNHLEAELVPANYFDFLKGKKITVIVDGDKTLAYSEARKRMAAKEWDIAFTLSPVNSIFAIDLGYTYVAAMFPDSQGYEGGLFVKNDSPIQSIDDIKADTVVALGGFNSASSFYMPSYVLYGRTITVDLGNRGQGIVDKIKSGEAEVGAAAIGDSIRKDDPELRIIHVSSKIPGGGVYLSPELSQRDKESLKKVMLSASAEIQKEANYGPNIPEPDYTEFRKIMDRVDTILVCSDFSKNPVQFFCPENVTISNIKGTVNGVSLKDGKYLLRTADQNNNVYYFKIAEDLFESIVGSSDLTKIQGKNVEINTPSLPIANQIEFILEINQPQQFQILD